MSARSIIFSVAAVAAALASTAFAVAPAAAASPYERSTTVSYADLNLSSPAGQATLDRRIKRAAEQVCGSEHDLSLKVRQVARECQSEVIAGAKAQSGALLALAARSITIRAL